MKEGLRLKIGKHWCVLGPSPSISIEMTSPLWNKSGSFSYTFEVPYSANRHIFNAAEMPESDVNLKRFRERFELYVEGIGLLFGDAICSSDEIDERKDKLDIELRSANATLEDAIEGKTLRDLDLGEDAYIGTFEERSVKSGNSFIFEHWYHLNPNENLCYPIKPFCNIPIIANCDDLGRPNPNSPIVSGPVVLSAARVFTSPCFFMLYVLKKVFAYCGFYYNESTDCELIGIEDFCRLVIINLAFKDRLIFESKEDRSDGNGPPVVVTYKSYATSGNLPDISISEFLDGLTNPFGVKILIDESKKKAKVILLKNIFTSTKVNSFNIKNISSIKKKHLSFDGVKVAYSTNDGDEYNYSEYKTAKVFDSYSKLLTSWSVYTEEEKTSDTTLKIVKETGNFYRTKVDKSSFDHPALFEVAQFSPYVVNGIGNSKADIEEISIPFTPIIPTKTANCTNFVFTGANPNAIPSEAFFIDVKVIRSSTARNHIESDYRAHLPEKRYWFDSKDLVQEVLDYDCGFTVGVLRTTPKGMSKGYEIVKDNADGFGNSQWVRTTSENVLTNDSVTHEGTVYDYNGTDEGIGTSLNQLLSLKLWCGKQNLKTDTISDTDNNLTGKDAYNNNPTGPLSNRGLVPQYLFEYLYFLKNRKPLEIELEMEVSEIANIKWDEYYDIAGYRILLDKISFTVTNDGIGMVTMEVYCI